MLPIDEETRTLLLHNSVHREIILRFPDDGLEIGSGNIVAESFELTQSICDSKDFKLGGGVVGNMQISVIDVDAELNGKRVNVFVRQTYSKNRLLPSQTLMPSTALIIGEQRQTVEYQLFSGKVNNVKRQKNRSVKKLMAYDAMYDFSKRTVSYLTISNMLQRRFQSSEVPLYDFTLAMLQMVSNVERIYHDETADFSDSKKLIFHESSIEQVAKNGIKMTELLQAYAEANAGFIVCTGAGDLRVKSLSRYVRFPASETMKKPVDEVIPAYKKMNFEEFTVRQIRWLTGQYQNDRIDTYGVDKSGSWYDMKNILFRMCSSITHFIENYWKPRNYLFFDLLTFRPYKADVYARWWLEPGDRVQIQTGCEDIPVVDSFVLSRKIKGINGMSVTVEAKGNEYLGNR